MKTGREESLKMKIRLFLRARTIWMTPQQARTWRFSLRVLTTHRSASVVDRPPGHPVRSAAGIFHFHWQPASNQLHMRWPMNHIKSFHSNDERRPFIRN